MGDLRYIDFDVAIEPAGSGFTARVFNSPVGQAASTFSAPFSDLEIENFLLRVGRSRHAVRRIESPEMVSAKQFGGRLFDQVFAGEVRGCLRSSLDEASRQGAGLRVRLHLTKVPALADLPWEFLYNASMNRFLSLSVETPLVRYLELPERIRPLIVQPPLRVLMMISSPSDYPQLDVKRESAKINEALGELEKHGLVTVERQEDATLAELQRRLRKNQYHIFHFVGHGGFDAQADDGLLIMEDQENRGRRVSAQFLGTILHDHRPLRLAVLNACEGARASRGDPFAGTAQSLVQQGIPAVIAMQFEVTDEAAICFTREFYSAIAVGYPVDAALAEARKAIFAEVSEIEWGTPVLYMRSPDGKVFEVEQVSEPARRQLHVSSLVTAARTATASNDHATAVEKLKEALTLEPEHPEAATLLADVTREQELAEKERARAAREEEVKEDPRPPEVEPAAVAVHASDRRPVSSLFMGGVLGVAAVVAVLLVGGVALVMFMAGQQSAASGSKTPPQNQSSATAVPDTPVHPQPSPARERQTDAPAQTLPRRENPPQRTPSPDLPAQVPPRDLSPKQPVASDPKGQDNSAAPEARLPSGSSILERHLTAVGGRDALLSHRSVHASGTLSMPAAGLTGTLDIYAAAPNRMLLKVSFPGVGDMFEGFDGTHAWSLSAMTGPTLLEGKALEEKKFDSEFNSELRSDSRYQSVTTLGEVDFEGWRCYKVRLLRRTGDEDIEFYDVASGLRAGRVATRETPLGPVTSTMVLTDYKRFGNLVQPATVRIQGGGVLQVIRVSWTEYDRVPASIFELPPQIIALVR
jgi:CHAT domain-containing protein